MRQWKLGQQNKPANKMIIFIHYLLFFMHYGRNVFSIKFFSAFFGKIHFKGFECFNGDRCHNDPFKIAQKKNNEITKGRFSKSVCFRIKSECSEWWFIKFRVKKCDEMERNEMQVGNGKTWLLLNIENNNLCATVFLSFIIFKI